MYKTLLFYKYVSVKDSEGFVQEHLQFCKDLKVQGRILVGKEGINGSLSGTEKQINTYMKELRKYPEFSDITFKVGSSKDHIFQKMHVRTRDEICVLNLKKDVDPSKETGTYIAPEEFKKLMESNEDFVIIDARNDYEWKVGKFKNAVTLDIEYFRDFPEKIKEIEKYKDKKVVTYCTGGIRCEKASALLKREGFKNVYQLEGGILNYSAQTDGSYFEGKCFMFDDRLVVPINKKEKKIISQCFHCKQPSDRFMNCPNIECNKLYICCEACDKKHQGFCCEECTKAKRIRDRRPVGVPSDHWELV